MTLLLALAAVALLVLPGTVTAKTLRDKQTGLALSAPKGSKLKRDGSAYIVTTKRLRITVSRLRTGQSPSTAGSELARALKSSAGKVKASKQSWRALLTPRAGGSASAVAVRKRGKTLVVGLGRGKGQASATAALTGAELIALQQLVDSVSGGRAAALGGTVALRQFVAPDGGASAFVPDRPGWSYSGGGGVVEGVNVDEGAFAFGVTFPVALPTPFPTGLIVSPYVAPDVALRTIIPEFYRRSGGQIAVTAATPFPGAPQLLGAPWASGFFSVSLQVGTTPFDGVFLVGTLPSLDGSFWQMYYSYAIVRRGAPAGLGPALLKTWASWNPSIDRQRRVNQTLATILSTNVGGGLIDQDVFDEAAAKWSAYIRK